MDVAASGSTVGIAGGQVWTGDARPHPAHRLHPLRPPPARAGVLVGGGKAPGGLLIEVPKQTMHPAPMDGRGRPSGYGRGGAMDGAGQASFATEIALLRRYRREPLER